MNPLKPLRKPAVAAVLLLGLLLIYNSNFAFAASGGRMGGSAFHSSTESRSSSSPSSFSTRSSPSSSSSESETYDRKPVGEGASNNAGHVDSRRCSNCDSGTYDRKTTVGEGASNSAGHVDWWSRSSWDWGTYDRKTFGAGHNDWRSRVSRDSGTYDRKPVEESSSNNSGHVGSGNLKHETGTEFAVFLVFIIILIFIFWLIAIVSEKTGKTSVPVRSVPESTGETTVLKLQVGLLNLRRTLQKDLNRIAKAADTSTKHGLHYILTETVLALLRQPDSYCISAYTSNHVMRNMEEGEKGFHQLSIEERVKIDEETLVNISKIEKQSSTIVRSTGSSNEHVMINVKRNMGDMRNRFHLLSVEERDEPDEKTFVKVNSINDHIMITILVAAEGLLKLPDINNRSDLRKALLELASLPLCTTLAVEVLWTPQQEDDSLSEHEMKSKYPLLRNL